MRIINILGEPVPVSKRPKRRDRSTINLLRGAGRTSAALVLARMASAQGYADAVPWAVKNLRLAGPLSALQPRRFAAIHSLPILDALPLEQELRWTTELLPSFADQVNAGISAREAVEFHLMRGEGDEALLALDAMEQAVGLSFLSLSTRLATLQISRGLDAQKEEYSRIRLKDAHQNVKFFCFWWSVRAEDSSSWANFRKDFERRLGVWDAGPELRAFIAFHILRDLPIAGEEQNLLSSSLLGSAIDLYEALLSLTKTAVIESRSTARALVAACAKLARDIRDPRLDALLFLYGRAEHAANLCPAETMLRDAKLSGVANPAHLPTNIFELLVAGQSDARAASRGSLPERLTYIAEEIGSPGALERGAAELRKLGAMFDHLTLGRMLGLMASNPRPTDRIAPAVAQDLFLTSPIVQPEALSALDFEQTSALDSLMPGGIPSTPAWQWFKVLAGRIPLDDAQSNFSPRARAELMVLDAVSREDDLETLRAVAELNSIVGEPTELALQAETRAHLNLNGLESTLSISVDRLLDQPKLAAWMPLPMLAEQIELQLPGPENIDLPIILDFAAKAGEARYASSRTYATEDLLTARGALHPSDLISSIPPDRATSRERYFAADVCTPANLRTSTMFGSERELESDRINVCQWLIEADPTGRERFEEEARELVRSRHIKLGVQALQGSKLSIDRTGLRRWADRTVAEDFERYIDLLEQGVFKQDDSFRLSVYSALELGLEAQQSLTIPDNEAASLFAGLTTALIREFGLHPEHGLDAYLSLRIRHGTLSGHLRGPVEQEHLITRRDLSGHYLENGYWTERLAEELSNEQLELINDCLQALSRRFDDIIVELTQNLLQVRREDKPKGLIGIDPSTITLAIMIAETRPGLTFDDFFTRCEDMFWVLVDASSTQISAAIAEVIDQMVELFERTEDRIREIAGDEAGPLKDAILRARASVTGAIEDIKGWLAPPTTSASLVLSVEELIRVSLAVICGFYRDFAPKVEFELEPLPSLSGVVRLFSDIFFILFENVLKYSGNAVDPSICIRAWEDGDYLRFRVENSVETADEAALERISSAKERIENGSFRRAVRGEGGTGLPKLAKVIGLGSGGGDLSFGLADEDKQFSVSFSLRKIDVAKFAEEQQ